MIGDGGLKFCKKEVLNADPGDRFGEVDNVCELRWEDNYDPEKAIDEKEMEGDWIQLEADKKG